MAFDNDQRKIATQGDDDDDDILMTHFFPSLG